MRTMKKTIIISAFAAALLTTGCVSNEVFSPEEKQVEICFTTPVVGSMTKAPVYGEIKGTTYDPKENFVIYAVRHPNTYDGWTSNNATTYINGGEFTYASYNDATAGSGGWKGLNTKYYWPESGVLSFGGYSPANAHSTESGNGKGRFEYGANGLVINGFSVHYDASKQQDVMYAPRIYNKESNAGGTNTVYDGVDIAFKHALSSIQFKVQLSADYSSTFVLKSIKVDGVYYSGTFKENVADNNTANYAIDPETGTGWTVTTTVKNTAPYVAFSGSVQLNKNTGDDAKNYINQYLALDGVDGQNDLILMPQVLPDEAELEIVYTVNGKEESSTVKLSDLNIKEWVMGQRYTYNITLGYDLILVGATVKNWDEEDDVNIPIN